VDDLNRRIMRLFDAVTADSDHIGNRTSSPCRQLAERVLALTGKEQRIVPAAAAVDDPQGAAARNISAAR